MIRLLITGLLLSASAFASDTSTDLKMYWMKVRAKDRFERSMVANIGAAIEGVGSDYVIAFGNEKEFNKLQQTGRVLSSFEYKSPEQIRQELAKDGKEHLAPRDFPKQDQSFHNYKEMTDEMTKLAQANPQIVEMTSIGKSVENRDIWVLRISKDLKTSSNLPAIIFMGGHHAREHLSVEEPFLIAQYLVDKYNQQDADVVKYLSTREIHIIPSVNPDGSEYDISSGSYKMWRKNRLNNGNSTYGVDLNRNYGYQWGTGGSSTDTSSDTYMGKKPFSEPETQAIKKYVEANKNINILLSFHTFSELILYPWGHSYNTIADQNDRLVHETMAKTMANWNGYTPEQSSDLYIASGDTTDWSYGEHKIISFTFELDPTSMWQGGFYPGQSYIQPVFQKNLKPVLYLIDYADDPYRVIKPTQAQWGLTTSIVQ